MAKENIKIAVAGTGYVGLSIATLLSQHHEVVAVDVVPEKVELINHRRSPIQDEYIEKYLAEKELNLKATTDAATAYRDADFVVIATPTNYDPVKNYFDTSHVEEVIQLVKEVNPDAIMVIKSTIQWATPRTYAGRWAARTSSSPRNSCARARRSTTISTLAASSWADRQEMIGSTRRHISSQNSCRREPSRRTSTLSSWDSQRQRR